MTEGPLWQAAAALAREAHAGQVRKGDARVPYFSHLESVAHRLRAAGYADDVTLAAAYLHDLIEDQPAWEPRLRAEFPAEVVATVEVLTERKLDAQGRKRSKAERFAEYLAGLRAGTEAARRALAVSCADKTDNVSDLVASERAGRGLLLELSTRPGQHAGQIAALREVYAPVVRPELLAAYDAAARALAAYLRAWLPGRAAALAAQAHQGQFDRSGAPYVLHPMRLMLRAETPEEQATAVLHDVLEDTPWTRARLADEGVPAVVLDALERLTRRAGEDYQDFVSRVVGDPLAARVKLWDLEDNMDARRLDAWGPRDAERMARYHLARRRVRSALGIAGGAERTGGGLVVKLGEASARTVRAVAAYPELRGDHVTLAHGLAREEFDARWVPGGRAVGQAVRVRVLEVLRDARVQVARVEVEGVRERAWDGGALHVTVSKVPGARSVESNRVLAESREVGSESGGAVGRESEGLAGAELEGTVAWAEG